MTAKITPAMRAWCGELANPAKCRWIRQGAALTMCGFTAKRAPHYAIVCRLERAGLIEWDQIGEESTARLTPAGQRLAQRSGKTFHIMPSVKRKQKPILRENHGTPPTAATVERLNQLMMSFRAIQRAGINEP